MILTIFRPKRTKDGKPHVSRSYRGRYRLEEEDKLTDIPLHTTDKRVARERLERIVREKQLEAVGVLSPHRTALQTPLEKHLSDYLADLQAVGRDDPVYLRSQESGVSAHQGMSLGSPERGFFRLILGVESKTNVGSKDAQ